MSDEPVYGRAEMVIPGVRRLLAPNPGPFTLHGTGTYIVGEGTVAVIDPGPDDPEHLRALLAAVNGETISHILVTHTHRDHSPLAVELKARTGAVVTGCAPLVLEDDGPRSDASFDDSYAPDHVMADGEAVSGPGWSLVALLTPGHTSNHVCFAYPEQAALFTGDHVMGWSTTVVSPPDGNMADYMDSLEKLRTREDRLYLPTHGAPIQNPQRLVRGLILHRRQREQQILTAIDDGRRDVPDMVARMYAGVDPRLHGAAGRSVLAHLIDLETRGMVARDGNMWQRAA